MKCKKRKCENEAVEGQFLCQDCRKESNHKYYLKRKGGCGECKKKDEKVVAQEEKIAHFKSIIAEIRTSLGKVRY